MSGPNAIGAVTATLRRLLEAGITSDPVLPDAIVTAQPLDVARDPAATANQLNIFLYLIAPNAAWRNQDMPGRTRPGEVASPPLPLNLFYLLSAYGQDNDTHRPFSHLLLGRAMSILHDHSLLGRDELRAALPDNDLGDQAERVRITLQPLSIEEISKLWAGFQMQFRLSVAYEVAVVLIDSTLAVRAAPPVLARGRDGGGFPSSADPLAAFPQLTALTPARPLRLGETLRLQGTGLTGDAVTVRFSPPPRVAAPVEVPATADPAGGFSVVVPAGMGLPAGACMVSLRISRAGVVSPTTELPLMLSPRITSRMPVRVTLSAAAPTAAFDISPAVVVGQRVALILGNREIELPGATGTHLVFPLAGVTTGTYLARIRVEGVDSLPVPDPDTAVPRIDPAQVVEVVA